MTSFDVEKIARHFDEVANSLQPGRKLTPADRHILSIRIEEIRKFLSCCNQNQKAVNKALAWTQV